MWLYPPARVLVTLLSKMVVENLSSEFCIWTDLVLNLYKIIMRGDYTGNFVIIYLLSSKK